MELNLYWLSTSLDMCFGVVVFARVKLLYRHNYLKLYVCVGDYLYIDIWYILYIFKHYVLVYHCPTGVCPWQAFCGCDSWVRSLGLGWLRLGWLSLLPWCNILGSLAMFQFCYTCSNSPRAIAHGLLLHKCPSSMQ